MNTKTNLKSLSLLAVALVIVAAFVFTAYADELQEVKKQTKLEKKLEEKARQQKKLDQKREEEARIKREKAQAEKDKAKETLAQNLASVSEVNLPEDSTPLMTVSSISISGNTLITDAEIIENIPAVWSASGEPVLQSAPEELYDFTGISQVILEPGTQRQISARTIQGFTQYVLSLYQKHHYAGIYVYVPRSAMAGANQLVDNNLVIEILEAPVTDVTVSSYDPDQNAKEKGYLKQDLVKKWSPVKPGEVANQKKVDDFVNLLNENPDRYVSAVVTKGAEDKTLAVNYDVYEANPWHWFIQLDNSGTRDRQWVPRIGLINTNLLGMDDTFTAIYQAPWEKDFDKQYSLYGSYEFPLAGPRLRLKIYGGYSEYDVNPESGPISFIGNGHFYGSELRYNILQTEPTTPVLGDGWFFDARGMFERIRSKVTPSLFPSLLGSNIVFNMWGAGLDLHKDTDLSSSLISASYWRKFGSDSSKAAFRRARTAADYNFDIYDLSARHSQFIDPNKINRISGSVRWVGTPDRLVPAKMTSFGGMYTVRGYDEYEIVADGGILASLQYEYDLIAAEKAKNPDDEIDQQSQEKNPYEIKRAAPLAFIDYGRTTVNSPVAGLGEVSHEELCSIGIGALLDVGDNFSGAVYYGYPLIATPGTRTGKGKVNVSFMLRW